MERVQLLAQSRSVLGKQVSQLRSQGLIPVVLYGPDTLAKSLHIPERDLTKALQQTGSTALIDLVVKGEPKPYVVLAREIQHDALSGRVRHVDFYQVRLTEKIKTTPRLEFIGESPAAKSGRGIVNEAMSHIEVECLPADLVNSIVVDLSVLENMEDAIFVRDLQVPSGIQILAGPDEVVANLISVRAEVTEEVEAAAVTVPAAEAAAAEED